MVAVVPEVHTAAAVMAEAEAAEDTPEAEEVSAVAEAAVEAEAGVAKEDKKKGDLFGSPFSFICVSINALRAYSPDQEGGLIPLC